MENLASDKKEFINSFLDKPILARIATVSPSGQPHVVPLWFGWDGTSLWIHTGAGSRKFRDLLANPLVSVSIDESLSGNGPTKAVILEGRAQLHYPLDAAEQERVAWIYSRYLGAERVHEKAYEKEIHSPSSGLIQLTPEKILTWAW